MSFTITVHNSPAVRAVFVYFVWHTDLFPAYTATTSFLKQIRFNSPVTVFAFFYYWQFVRIFKYAFNAVDKMGISVFLVAPMSAYWIFIECV